MPIKPENKHRYPSNWPWIRARILERAHNRCECLGECGKHQGPDVHSAVACFRENGAEIRLDEPDCYGVTEEFDFLAGGDPIADAYVKYNEIRDPRTGDWRKVIVPGTFTRVVLTIAHLDHTPENCDFDNLRAYCQRCHLAYDAKHHAQTRYETRRLGKASVDLFALTQPTPAPSAGSLPNKAPPHVNYERTPGLPMLQDRSRTEDQGTSESDQRE